MRAARGFTLIELLVAMALGTILVGVTSFIFINAKKLYDHSLQEIATTNEMRGGFERLGRDLQDVQVKPVKYWEPLITQDTDVNNGPQDSLVYVSLERTATTTTPIRVEVRLGPRDSDGLARLIRTVTHRGADPKTWALTDVKDTEQVLLDRVRSFMVEYAWPSQGTAADLPKGTNAGHVFIRGAGVGPWSGPAPDSGLRFLYAGDGTITNGTLTISTASYDTSPRLIPRRLASRVFVNYTASPTIVNVFPVIDVPTNDASGATTNKVLTLTGAPDGAVKFWLPLTPKAVQVTIKHESRNGPRMVTEVLGLSPGENGNPRGAPPTPIPPSSK